MHVVHCDMIVMNCIGIWIIADYDICLGGVASTVDTDCTIDLLCC